MNKRKIFELVGRWKQRADDLLVEANEAAEKGSWNHVHLIMEKEAAIYRICANELAKVLGWFDEEAEGFSDVQEREAASLCG